MNIISNDQTFAHLYLEWFHPVVTTATSHNGFLSLGTWHYCAGPNDKWKYIVRSEMVNNAIDDKGNLNTHRLLQFSSTRLKKHNQTVRAPRHFNQPDRSVPTLLPWTMSLCIFSPRGRSAYTLHQKMSLCLFSPRGSPTVAQTVSLRPAMATTFCQFDAINEREFRK